MSLLLALVACTTIEHTETLTATTDLPEVGVDCVPSQDDVSDGDGTRIVSRVAPDGAACRADVYARSVLIDWEEVEGDVSGPSPLGALRVEWISALGSFSQLALTDSSGATAPPATEVAVAQLLSTYSAAQSDFDADPVALLEDLAAGEIGDYPEHLLGFEHRLEGDETDLVAAIGPVQDGPGPMDIVNVSWDDNDAVLYLVTVASVAVPFETLEAFGDTELSLAIEESVVFEADIHYRMFGREE